MCVKERERVSSQTFSVSVHKKKENERKLFCLLSHLSFLTHIHSLPREIQE